MEAPLTDDDLHLALCLCYELHYTAIDGVNPAWEWEPSLLEFRRAMEDAFEKELIVGVSAAEGEVDIASTLATIAESDSGWLWPGTSSGILPSSDSRSSSYIARHTN